jgi:hypothetical protein
MNRKPLLIIIYLFTITINAEVYDDYPTVSRQLEAFQILKDSLNGLKWTVPTLDELLKRDKSPLVRYYKSPFNFYGNPHCRIDELDLSNNNLEGKIPDLFNYEFPVTKKWVHFYSNSAGILKLSHNKISDASSYVGITDRGGFYKELWLDHNELTSFDIIDASQAPLRSSGNTTNCSQKVMLNNNEITSLTKENLGQFNMSSFTCLMGWSTELFRIDNNRINFNDIIKLNNKLKSVKSYIPMGATKGGCAYEFIYAPQKALGGNNVEYTLSEGENLSLNFSLIHPDNQYSWLKNGKPINVFGKDLEIRNFDKTQAGVYTCKVTNPNLPDLVLYSFDMAVWFKRDGNKNPTYIGLNNTKANNKMPLFTNVARLSGDDPDDDELFFRLDDKRADNSCFRIVNGKTLVIAEDLFGRHYIENYKIVVEVYDSFGGKFEKEFTITKGEVETTIPYPKSISLTNNNLNENGVCKIGNVELEGVSKTDYTINLESGVLNNDLFSLTKDSLFNKKKFDYEEKSNYQIRLKLTSSDNKIVIEKDFDIVIHNINDAPHNISLTNSQLKQNAPLNSLVGYLFPEDQDIADENFVFELIAGGADNKFFTINKNRLFSAKNFSESDIGNKNIRIKVTDPKGASYERGFVVSIVSTVKENQVPRGIGVTNALVFKNMKDGDEIGYVYMSDPEGEEGTFVTSNEYVKIEDNRLLLKSLPTDTNMFDVKIEATDGENVLEQDIRFFYVNDDKMSRDNINYYDFQVCPNPTTNTIRISGLERESVFEIFDIKGSLFIKTSKKEIDVSMLKQGNYIIRCKTKDNYFSRIFVKL